jgi:predicted nucleic acid-binding Zn finger protein
MATRADEKTVEGRTTMVLERFDRAAKTLSVEEVERELYLVTGGAEPHWVAPGQPDNRCDCADYLLRGVVTCKHQLAVKLHQTGGIVEDVLGWANTRQVA